jgi:hypothetical protein
MRVPHLRAPHRDRMVPRAGRRDSGCVAESSESTAGGETDSGSTTADGSFRDAPFGG